MDICTECVMTTDAKFIQEITVIDPDTNLPVEVAIYKDEASGGLFGIDSSFVLSLDDGDFVTEPFNGTPVNLIEI